MDFNKDLALYNVYEIRRIYTPKGPDYSDQNMAFRLLMQREGKGVNWAEMVNREMTFYMVAHGEEIDHEKLRTADKLILADDLWTCKCTNGRYVHRNPIPICIDCKTVRQYEWDFIIYKHKQKEMNRAPKLYPYLHELWDYEPKDFEATMDQVMALTIGSWMLLEPTEERMTEN